MQSERKSSGINIGSASIIMVFAVLCLTVFAVLSFITANSEYKLAVKSANSVKDYYAADTAASEVVASISTMADATNGSFTEMSKQLTKAGFETENTTSGLVISFKEKVSDTQDLSVNVTFDGKNIIVNSWKLESSASWTPSDSAQLWGG